MKHNAKMLPPDADPIERSRIYLMLKRMYRYPTSEFYVRLREGQFLQELREAFLKLSHADAIAGEWTGLVRHVRKSMEVLSFSEFEAQFVRTFEVGAPQPPCPLYEGFNTNAAAPRNRVMLELSEFYGQFGLALSKEEGRREMPDHICCELEFLHFLTFKENQAREDEAAELLQGYVLAQRDFLRRHLASWTPLLAQRVKTVAAATAFGPLCDLTARFLQKDLALAESHLKEMNVRAPAPPPISRGEREPPWVDDANGTGRGCLPE